MSVARNIDRPTPLNVALAHAARGRPVAPGCPPGPDGACTCGGKWDRAKGQLVPHGPKEVGKAPIGGLVPTGISEATTNSATIDRHWRAKPDANVNIELAASGLLVVDADSPEVKAAALSRGLDGVVVRDSRNRAYVFKRPADCPVINLIKADGDPLDVLTKGNFVAWGTHATGVPVRMDPDAETADAPAWVVELLVRKQATIDAAAEATRRRREERSAPWAGGREPPVRLHTRGQRRWNGELVELADGHVDRDKSLFYIGLDLAECGASEPTIVAALAERDVALNWEKFTGCGDADTRYGEIADKAVARVIKQEQAPRLQVVPAPEASTVPDDVAELRAALEREQAEVGRLRRALLDRDDRLEVLEDLVHTIDDVLARPDEELCSDDKVVTIAGARWLPFYRSKRLANDEQPTITLGYLSKVVGLPSRRVSKSLDRLSADEQEAGAPFRKRVTRRHIPEEARWESTLEVMPWGERTSDTLRAAATYATPARPKRGGSQAASDARWGRCDKHDNRDVLIKGHCPDCGKVVGERRLSLADFDALNVQVGHSEDGPAHGAEGYLVDVQNGHSGGLGSRQEHVNLQPVHSDPADELADRRAREAMAIPLGRAPDPSKQPGYPMRESQERVSLGPIVLNGHAREQSPRRQCRPCPSLELYELADGRWRCEGCGEVYARDGAAPIPRQFAPDAEVAG